jgi:hypothetical protein
LFSEEVSRELQRLPADSPAWKHLAAELAQDPGVTELNDPVRLRTRVLDEVLLDTACGLYNAAVRGKDELNPNDPAFACLAHLEALFRCRGLNADDRRAFLGPAWLLRLSAYEKAKDFGRAETAAKVMLSDYPERIEYQDRVAEAIWTKALESVSASKDEEICRQQAETLNLHIERLEAFRQEHPCSAACYDYLASLHHLRAVKLANGDRVSQALLAVEKALAYRPNWEEAFSTRAEIEKLLHSVQQYMLKVQSQLGTRYFGSTYRVTTLSDKGQAIKHEADEGTKPRDHYRRSDIPKQIAADRRKARARSLWERIGLAKPEGDWDRRAIDLDEATDMLLARRPSNGTELLSGWFTLTAEHPELKLEEFDALKVCTFFLQSQREPENAPLLEAPQVLATDMPPPDLWLFSSRDLGLKIVAAASIALVAVGLFLSHRADVGERERNAAFAELQSAVAAFDEAEAVAAGDRFLAAVGASSDGRAETVRSLREAAAAGDWTARRHRDVAYRDFLRAVEGGDVGKATASARAFLELPGAAKDPRRPQVASLDQGNEAQQRAQRNTRDEAYKHLEKACAAEDDQAVGQFAKAFLDALPPRDDDPRRDQVTRLQALAVEAPRRKARDDAYRTLCDASPAVRGAADAKDREAMGAAAKFLAAKSTLPEGDPRQKQVEELQAFVAAAPRRRLRDAAYDRVVEAVQKGFSDQTEAIVQREAAAFFQALPEGENDSRAEQVRRLADYAAEGPNLRKRTAAYDVLRAAAQRHDDVAALKAIGDYRQAKPLKIADPRDEQVAELETLAAEWPLRRQRDAAWKKLQSAMHGGHDQDTLQAAEEFLDARPRRDVDARTEQVWGWYDAAFVRWFSTRPQGKDAPARIAKYNALLLTRSPR